MILDAGVLIALERGDARACAFLRLARRRSEPLHTSEPVVAQVWRDGHRQARLAQALAGIEIHPFDDGRAVGRLLARSSTTDPIDAHLVWLGTKLRQPILTGDQDGLVLIGLPLGPAAPEVHAWPPA